MLPIAGFLEGRYELHIIMALPPSQHKSNGKKTEASGYRQSCGRLHQFKDSHAQEWYGSSGNLNSRGFAGLYSPALDFSSLKAYFKYTTACMFSLIFHDFPICNSLFQLLESYYRTVVFAYLPQQVESCCLKSRIYIIFDAAQSCLVLSGNSCLFSLYALVQYSRILFNTSMYPFKKQIEVFLVSETLNSFP